MPLRNPTLIDATDDHVVHLAAIADDDDFAIADPLDDPDDLAFPNPVFAARRRELELLEGQRVAQEDIGLRIGELVEIDRRPRSDTAGDALPRALQGIADALDRIDRTLATFDRTERDNVVALYAVGFGPHGHASDHSAAGIWISEAWRSIKSSDEPSICAIAKLSSKNRDLFKTTLLKSKAEHGVFVDSLTETDLRRFLDLAPEACRSIDAIPPGAPTAA